MKAIEFKGVWEKYRIKYIDEGRVWWEELWALEDINFSLDKGKVLGIIGKNGAGKTTLLKLIAGMLVPDRGEIKVEGKVSTLMELGAGFNPEFTGKENILINAQLYGLKEEELEMRLKEIIEFAGLGKFIHAPLKYYSQGMFMRLAFSLAIFVEPDILLIDDILAVGDREAQEKCIKKVFELKDKGKTIVLVSHDMGMIEKLCDEVILLDKGKVVFQGLPQEVIPRYLEISGDEKGIGILEKESLRIVFNNGRIFINYNKIPLTKDIGGYLSFFLPKLGNWSSSLNLNWQIKKQWVNGFIAEGSSFDGNVVQTWEMSVEKDKFDWKIKINEDSIKEAHIDLLLTPEYKGWLSLEKKGEFGPFLHKSNWQELSLDNYKGNIIGIRTDGGRRDFPNLLFEVDNAQFKLFNTGYNQESRVIQLCLGGDYISVRANIFPDIDAFEEYFRIQREKLLAQRSINLGALRLFCDLENKSIRLYYRDKEITKATGLHSSFLIDKVWYETSSAEWKIDKEGDLIILEFFWKDLGFIQSWRMFFKDNYLNWQVTYELEKPFNFSLLKFGLLLTEEYKGYFCGHQQGRFPEEFSFWQDIPLENLKAEWFGLRKEEGLPAIILKNRGGFNCAIQNSDKKASCRVLQLGIPLSELNQKSISFATEIKFLEDETFIEEYLKKEREKLLAQRSINSGALRLFCDLENKSIRLYYRDKEITKWTGLYSSFVYNHQWYDTGKAEWEVEKKDRDLIIRLKWMGEDIRQEWRLYYEESKLVWEIKHATEINLGILKFGLILNPEYQRYFCGYEEGKFPLDFTVWQNMPLLNPWASRFGVRKEMNLPAIIIERPEETSIFFQNGDKTSLCRDLGIAVSKTFLEKKIFDLKTSFGFLEEEKAIEEYLSQERSKINLLDKKEDLLSISLNYFSIYVDIESKSIRLYYKGKEITRGKGLSTTFCVKNHPPFNLSHSRWQTKKISSKELLLIVQYEPLAVIQTWTLSIDENQGFKFKIEMDVAEFFYLIYWDIIIELSGDYVSWKTAYEEKNFSGNWISNDICPIRMREKRISKLVLEQNLDKNLPLLSFDFYSDSGKRILSMFKRKEKNEEIIVINSSIVYPLEEQKISPGEHKYGEGRILIGKEISLEEKTSIEDLIELKNKYLRVTFTHGKGDIFWKEKNLTSGLGIFTSLRLERIWYDSYQAAWQIKEKDRNRIIAIGTWGHIPLVQIWELKIMEDNLIYWRVDSEIYEELNLEIEQTNLMLSSEYKNWIVPNFMQGNFPDEYTQDYDILPFRFWYGETRQIIADAENLPQVIFKNNLEDRTFRAIVENTDYLYRARLLQYQKANIYSIKPGKYLYFEGEIEIVAKK